MKKLLTLLFLNLVLFNSGAALAEAGDAQENYAVIGVINLVKIQSEGKVYKDIVKKRNAYLEKYKDEIAKKEQEFRKMDQELAEATKAGESSADLEKKKDEFVKQLRDFQSKVQVRKEKIGEAFIKITSKVQIEELAPIIEEVASEKGVNIVLNNAQIVFFAPFMDMTDEVMKRLNEKVPSVDFPNPDKM